MFSRDFRTAAGLAAMSATRLACTPALGLEGLARTDLLEIEGRPSAAHWLADSTKLCVAAIGWPDTSCARPHQCPYHAASFLSDAKTSSAKLRIDRAAPAKSSSQRGKNAAPSFLAASTSQAGGAGRDEVPKSRIADLYTRSHSRSPVRMLSIRSPYVVSPASTASPN